MKKTSEEGRKYDEGKLDYTLIPWDMLEEVVRVLMFGAKQYGEGNWVHVQPKERYLKAAFRHLVEISKGNERDSDTGYLHAAHLVCCGLFYGARVLRQKAPAKPVVKDKLAAALGLKSKGVSR